MWLHPSAHFLSLPLTVIPVILLFHFLSFIIPMSHLLFSQSHFTSNVAMHWALCWNLGQRISEWSEKTMWVRNPLVSQSVFLQDVHVCLVIAWFWIWVTISTPNLALLFGTTQKASFLLAEEACPPLFFSSSTNFSGSFGVGCFQGLRSGCSLALNKHRLLELKLELHEEESISFM